MSTNTIDKPIWLGWEEAAEFLGVPHRTLKHWVEMRWVPYYRLGNRTRFDLNKLKVFLEMQEGNTGRRPVPWPYKEAR